MTLIHSREFRYEKGAALLVGLLGAGFVGFGGLFLWKGLALVQGGSTLVVLGLVTGAIGALLIAVGIHRRRQVIEISPPGIRFTRDGEITPWSEIRSIAPEPLRGRIKILDGAGRTVGHIPAGFDNEGVLLHTIASRTTALIDPIPERFEGAGGRWTWFYALLPLWYITKVNFTRLAVAPLRFWVIIGAFLAILLYQFRDRWGRTGRFEIRVDRSGMGYSGRGGAFDLRWPEIRALTLVTGGQEGAALVLEPLEGRPRRIPVTGVDLIPLFAAIRQHGGPLFDRMLLDPTADQMTGGNDPALLSTPRG